MKNSPLFENGLSDQQKDLIEYVNELGLADFEDTKSVKNLLNHQLMGICIPESFGGLGMDFKSYAVVAAELARQNRPIAMSWMLHVCSTMLMGQVMDNLEIPESKRLGHNRRRGVHYKRILENKVVYAYTFSHEVGEDVGSSPHSVIAEPITGGWLVNGQKKIAKSTSDSDYYSVLCTEIENREEAERQKTVYLAVAKHESGVSIESIEDMEDSQQLSLVLKNVFVRERELLIPRGFFIQLEDQWPYLFLMFLPLYIGLSQAVYDCMFNSLKDGSVEGDEVSKILEEMDNLQGQAKEAFLEVVSGEGSGETQFQNSKAVHCSFWETLKNLLELTNTVNLEQNLILEKLSQEAETIEQLLPWQNQFCS